MDPNAGEAAIVIMAGGSGERFWPVSNRATPKQLLRLHGDRTMIRAAFDRAARIVPENRVFVAAGERLRDAIFAALPRLAPDNYIAEPFARNTAACLGLAACRIEAALGPAAVMGVLTADHIIDEGPAFFRAVAGAMTHAAESGDLVTIGIAPTHPDTGFGYLEIGAEIATRPTPHGDEAIRRVDRFAEKPDAATAERFLAAGNFLWNSGMFFFRADALLDAFAAHRPEMSAEFARLRDGSSEAFSAERVAEVFGAIPSLPIDTAIMERSDRVAATIGRFGWQDVGSWDALERLGGTDSAGNKCVGPALVVDSRGNIVYNATDGDATAPRIVLHGVEDMIVVRTDRAILVTPKSMAQSVKKVVKRLDEEGLEELL